MENNIFIVPRLICHFEWRRWMARIIWCASYSAQNDSKLVPTLNSSVIGDFNSEWLLVPRSYFEYLQFIYVDNISSNKIQSATQIA